MDLFQSCNIHLEDHEVASRVPVSELALKDGVERSMFKFYVPVSDVRLDRGD
jgi:hypothetical protein